MEVEEEEKEEKDEEGGGVSDSFLSSLGFILSFLAVVENRILL